jgi:SMI1 / KNR4 family (SUKH-1)
VTAPLKESLNRIASVFRKTGYDVRQVVVEPVASSQEVQELESILGFQVPVTFRQLLTTVSRRVIFRWFVPEGLRFPSPLQSISSGDLHWYTKYTAFVNAEKDSWVRNCFPDKANAYDVVWHQKLAFYEVGNGDYLAIDLAPGSGEAVVYLSHDDGDGHGYVMAENVLKLVERWIPVGCCGGEDWQWLTFTNRKSTPLDPKCENAVACRAAALDAKRANEDTLRIQQLALSHLRRHYGQDVFRFGFAPAISFGR